MLHAAAGTLTPDWKQHCMAPLEGCAFRTPAVANATAVVLIRYSKRLPAPFLSAILCKAFSRWLTHGCLSTVSRTVR